MKLHLLNHQSCEKKPLSNDGPLLKYLVYTAGSVLALELVYFPIRKWFFMRQFQPTYSYLDDLNTFVEESQCVERFDSAVYLGNVHVVKTALHVNPELAVKQINHYGFSGTPLQLASISGHTDIVSLLVECPNVSMHKRYKGNKSILILAAESHQNEQRLQAQWTGVRRFLPFKRKSIFDFFIEMGVDVDHQDKEGNSALIAACTLNHVQIASKLLDLGADPMLENRRGITAVDMIIENSNLQRVLASKIHTRCSRSEGALSSNGNGQESSTSMHGTYQMVGSASDEHHASVDEWNSCYSSLDDGTSSNVSSSGSTNAIYLER